MYPSPTWQPEDTGVATEFTPEEADHDVSKRESTASDPGGPPPSGAGPCVGSLWVPQTALCGADDSRLSHCPLVLLPHAEDSSRATHTPACLWNTVALPQAQKADSDVPLIKLDAFSRHESSIGPAFLQPHTLCCSPGCPTPAYRPWTRAQPTCSASLPPQPSLLLLPPTPSPFKTQTEFKCLPLT